MAKVGGSVGHGGGLVTGFRSLANVGHMPGQSVIERTSRSVTVRTRRGFGSYDITHYSMRGGRVVARHVRRHIPG